MPWVAVKHGKHNQLSHGRKGAAGKAGASAYSAARASGASVGEARAAARTAVQETRAKEKAEAQAARVKKLEGRAEQARRLSQSSGVTEAQRQKYAEQAERFAARARGERVGREQEINPSVSLRTNTPDTPTNRPSSGIQEKPVPRSSFTPPEIYTNDTLRKQRMAEIDRIFADPNLRYKTGKEYRAELNQEYQRLANPERTIAQLQRNYERTQPAREKRERQQERRKTEIFSSDTIAANAPQLGTRFRSVPADEQRQLFGAAITRGRMAWDVRKGIGISFVVGFGGDWTSDYFTPAQLAWVAQQGENITLTNVQDLQQKARRATS